MQYMIQNKETGSRTYLSAKSHGRHTAIQTLLSYHPSTHQTYVENSSPYRFVRDGVTAPGSERWVSLNPHLYPSTD